MYNGPATVALTRAEIEHLDLLLRLYPRAENADLRRRIKEYLESTWQADSEKRAKNL